MGAVSTSALETAVLLPIFRCGLWIPSQLGEAMKEQRLSITGMSCASCVSRVETALQDTPGVDSVVVNLATNEATIVFDDTTVSIDNLVSSVDGAGYGVAEETATFAVDGMSCAACVSRVASALEQVPGVKSAVVNLATNEATVRHLSLPHKTLQEAVERAGYSISLASTATTAQGNDRLKARLVVAAILSGILMILGSGPARDALSPSLIPPLLAILAGPVQFWCGWPFLSGFFSALRHGSANMNSLIAVGTLSAWGYSLVITLDGVLNGVTGSEHLYFDTATMIITFVLLGRVLEHRARSRTSDAIRALIDLQPEVARVVRDGIASDIPVDQVVLGDSIHVRPGDRVPVDGRIVEGSSSIDESLITGESMPVEKQPGDAVTGGSINKTGSFYFEATGVSRRDFMKGIVATGAVTGAGLGGRQDRRGCHRRGARERSRAALPEDRPASDRQRPDRQDPLAPVFSTPSSDPRRARWR